MTPVEFESSLRALRLRLAQELPGHSPVPAETPEARSGVEAARARGCREAAALVLLFPGDRGFSTVLTTRSAAMRHHAGQISLPGGALEDGESVEDAARREAHEELGLDAPLTFVGQLSALYVPPSGYCLCPVVAGTPRRPVFVPNPDEVSDVIEVDLAALLQHGPRREEWREVGGAKQRVPFYQVGPHKVWGATGLVLRELIRVLREVEAAQQA